MMLVFMNSASGCFKSVEEEAMDIIGKHMGIMRLEKKKDLSEIYAKLIFPCQGLNWMDVKWTTQWGVTFVTMWDKEHLLKNIWYSMLMEMMGLGPMKYCIVYNDMPNFFNKLLLLLIRKCAFILRVSSLMHLSITHLGWRSEMPFAAVGFI